MFTWVKSLIGVEDVDADASGKTAQPVEEPQEVTIKAGATPDRDSRNSVDEGESSVTEDSPGVGDDDEKLKRSTKRTSGNGDEPKTSANRNQNTEKKDESATKTRNASKPRSTRSAKKKAPPARRTTQKRKAPSSSRKRKADRSEKQDLTVKVARSEYPVMSLKERLPIGTRIQKEFPPHGMFEGEIVSYSAEGRFYRIQYADGDSEDLPPADVLKLRVTTKIETTGTFPFSK